MNPPAGRNDDAFSGARIAPHVRGMGHDRKGTKPRQRHHLPLRQGFAEDREEGFFRRRIGSMGVMGRVGCMGRVGRMGRRNGRDFCIFTHPMIPITPLLPILFPTQGLL